MFITYAPLLVIGGILLVAGLFIGTVLVTGVTVGPGILISFASGEGREEFWAQAGSVNVGTGDAVTVYYDPARAATSATVKNAGDVRVHAIGSTVFALAIFAIIRL